MRRVLLTLTLVGTVVLSGCSSMSQSQCLASDWQSVGYRDGLAGKNSTQIMRHQNACVKHGITPDREVYLAGWNEGVEQFCTPQNGFTVGERGGSYGNVCPEYLHHAFFEAYQDGRQLYLAQAEIRSLESQIILKQRRLTNVEKELSDAENLLIEGNLTSLQRRDLLDETKTLAQEQGQLETEIEDLKIDAAVKSDRLQSLRLTLAYNG